MGYTEKMARSSAWNDVKIIMAQSAAPLMAAVAALTFILAMALAGAATKPATIPAPPAANVDVNWITLLGAATGTGTELQCGGATQVVVEFEASSGVTAGVVVLEHSAVSGYAGTWALLDSEDFSVSPLGSATKAIFTYPGPLGFVRPRIATTFSGGATPTVTVRAKRMFGQ